MATWLITWQHTWKLYYCFGKTHPTARLLTDLQWEDLAAVQHAVDDYYVVYFRNTPLETHVFSINEIPERNNNLLEVCLPQRTPSGLRYGSIGSVAKDPEAIAAWKSIVREVYAKTTSGVWYSLPGKRRRTPEPDVRYTDEAQTLWEKGERLVGGGESIVVALSKKHV